jgi:nitrate reductase NapE component
MKTIQNLYRQFPIVSLFVIGMGICIWAFSMIFLVVLIAVACMA